MSKHHSTNSDKINTMISHGSTIESVARECGVSPLYVTKVLIGVQNGGSTFSKRVDDMYTPLAKSIGNKAQQ